MQYRGRCYGESEWWVVRYRGEDVRGDVRSGGADVRGVVRFGGDMLIVWELVQSYREDF